ncbi:MAG: 5'-nucleotidase C-terminal domain-containing protein [Bacteroidota bacterium]|nr:5'-nucleotidase C-terminal domain-containing protein [Bacteroidota bacterium]
MVVNKFSSVLIGLVCLLSACTVQHISKTDVNYTIVRKESAAAEKPEVTAAIAPYKVQLDAEMNEVIGNVPVQLTKQRPESTLGNWSADVALEHLRKEGFEVDFAILNYGGLRVPYITQGPLTRGEIFELAPFDNILVIMDVPGAVLDSALQLIAQSEGWPVSKGVKLVLSGKKLVSAQLLGQPLKPTKIYKVATVDYVATGGDEMKMLIPLSRKNTNILFRDALLAYVKSITAEGKPITSSIEGRISVQ